MKKINKLLSVVLLFLTIATTTLAQVSATANATTTIIDPISITWVSDMNFGNIAVSNVAGEVTLKPSGMRVATGGCTLPSITGAPTAASFTVGGQAGYSYSISLPTSLIITRVGGSQTMVIDNFKSSPTHGLLDAGGAETLNVGGTLNVSSNLIQLSGEYTGGPFTVTVNYN